MSKEKEINKTIKSKAKTKDLEGDVLVSSSEYEKLVRESKKGPQVIDKSIKNTKKRKILNGVLLGASIAALGGGAAMLAIGLTKQQPQPQPGPVDTKQVINYNPGLPTDDFQFVIKNGEDVVKAGDEVETGTELTAEVTVSEGVKKVPDKLEVLKDSSLLSTYTFKDNETTVKFVPQPFDVIIKVSLKDIPPNKCHITFSSTDKEVKFSGSTVIDVEENQTIGPNFPMVSKPGYIFDYWKSNEEKVDENTNVKDQAEMTIIPVFKQEIVTYTATFYADHGNYRGAFDSGVTYIENTVKSGTLFKDLKYLTPYSTNPNRKQKFAGWCLDTECTIPVPENQTITANSKFYAKYENDSTISKITFLAGSGGYFDKDPSGQEIKEKEIYCEATESFSVIGKPIVIPYDPVAPDPASYFDCWCYYDKSKPDGCGDPVDLTKIMSTDTTIIAKYISESETTVKIDYILDPEEKVIAGTDPSVTEAKDKDGNFKKLINQNTPTLEKGTNYFSKWVVADEFTYINESDVPVTVLAGDDINENITLNIVHAEGTFATIKLKAVWIAGTEITWDPNGGRLPESWYDPEDPAKVIKDKTILAATSTWADATKPEIKKDNYRIATYESGPDIGKEHWQYYNSTSQEWQDLTSTTQLSALGETPRVRPVWKSQVEEIYFMQVKTIGGQEEYFAPSSTMVSTTNDMLIQSVVYPAGTVNQNCKWEITKWDSAGGEDTKPTITPVGGTTLDDAPRIAISQQEVALDNINKYFGTLEITATSVADSSVVSEPLSIKIVPPSANSEKSFTAYTDTADENKIKWVELDTESICSPNPERPITGKYINKEEQFFIACWEFNSPVYVGENITSLPPYFLSKCVSFDSPIIFGENSKLNYIGQSFLDMTGAEPAPGPLNSGHGLPAFNQNLEIPDSVHIIGSEFMFNCVGFTNGGVELKLPMSIEYISNDFLCNCYNFNVPITFPDKQLQEGYDPETDPGMGIGIGFLSGCVNFKQNITIPSYTYEVGEEFMFNCQSMYGNDSTIPPATINLACPSYIFKYSPTNSTTLCLLNAPSEEMYINIEGLSLATSAFVELFAQQTESGQLYRNLKAQPANTITLTQDPETATTFTNSNVSLTKGEIYEVTLKMPNNLSWQQTQAIYQLQTTGGLGPQSIFDTLFKYAGVYDDQALISSSELTSQSFIKSKIFEFSQVGNTITFRFKALDNFENLTLSCYLA